MSGNGKIMCNHGVNLFKCQTCIDALVAEQIELMQRKNDALVARVVRLEQFIFELTCRSAMPEYVVDTCEKLLNETESESLTHIQADAIDMFAEENSNG